MRYTTTSKTPRPRLAARLRPVLGATALAACGIYAACAPSEPEATVSLTGDQPFVVIPKASTAEAKALRQKALRAAGVIDQYGTGDDFYLAINKRELGAAKQWFLSAYLKQFFPGAVSGGAARSLGTRVVSFRQQNGKLFVFDTGAGNKTSDTFNPDLLVEAYPVVAYAPFDRLPGASQYVLFDPAAGMNRFSLLKDAYAGGSQPDQFNVELAFSQRYRSLDDGITFEEVFAGYGNLYNPSSGREANEFRSSGTLGIGIRRYAETPGYTESRVYTSADGEDLFFRGDARLVPNTGAQTQGSVKWAVSAMKPIQWVVSPDIDKLQASSPDFMGVDLYGAIAKGVTNWNTVFGYEALKVRKGTADDSWADDDTNYILVDLDPSYGAAFANWRTNPNTSEVRGASVYFSSLWAQIADLIFTDDTTLTALPKIDKPQVPTLLWAGMPASKATPLCDKWAPIYKGTGRLDDSKEALPHIPAATLLTKKQKIEQYITHVVLHEVGHTLGLRHNFKGSLKFDPAKSVYTSSVMEYIDDFDAIFASTPQSYDIDAIKLLYGLSMTAPKDQFCNDGNTAFDPDCTTFDRTDNPYAKVNLPSYKGYLTDFLDGKSSVAPNNTLNVVLGYLRQATTVAGLNAVFADVANQTGYSVLVGKVDATKLKTIPGYGARADFIARRIMQRLFLDDASLRGRFTDDPPSEPTFDATVLAELTGQIKNTDKIRSVASRKVAANILKKLQTVDAFNALREGSAALAGDIMAGTLSPDEQAQAEDLLKYIDTKLLAPYFNN
jgi:hypothetical protein